MRIINQDAFLSPEPVNAGSGELFACPKTVDFGESIRSKKPNWVDIPQPARREGEDNRCYMIRSWNEREAELQRRMKEYEASRPKRGYRGGTFTTQYAVDWAKAQGWKIIDRERFDARTRRHHDIEYGMDIICRKADGQRVGVQAAGRSERKEHYNRFTERGGPASAAMDNTEILYVEFERGNKTPLNVERWA